MQLAREIGVAMGIKSVEMVRSIRDKHYEETKEMTKEEYLTYRSFQHSLNVSRLTTTHLQRNNASDTL